MGAYKWGRAGALRFGLWPGFNVGRGWLGGDLVHARMHYAWPVRRGLRARVLARGGGVERVGGVVCVISLATPGVGVGWETAVWVG